VGNAPVGDLSLGFSSFWPSSCAGTSLAAMLLLLLSTFSLRD
jgi:hypothetical protein